MYGNNGIRHLPEIAVAISRYPCRHTYIHTCIQLGQLGFTSVVYAKQYDGYVQDIFHSRCGHTYIHTLPDFVMVIST